MGDGKQPTRMWVPGPDLTQPGRSNLQVRLWPSSRPAAFAVNNSLVAWSIAIHVVAQLRARLNGNYRAHGCGIRLVRLRVTGPGSATMAMTAHIVI